MDYRLRDEPKIGQLLGRFVSNSGRVVERGQYRPGWNLSLDEAMVRRFQGHFRRVFRRQPKPTSEGMKLILLCDPCGFTLAAMLAQGEGSPCTSRSCAWHARRGAAA